MVDLDATTDRPPGRRTPPYAVPDSPLPTALAASALAAPPPAPDDRAPSAAPPDDRAAVRALPVKTACALAALTGVLYFLAFPGMDLWPLAFGALAPLLVALEGQTPKRGLLLGAIAGFTMNVLGFYWLFGMLRTFSGFPTPLCALFMAILCAYQGGRIALCGWLFARMRQRGYARSVVFLLAFATSELVFPLLFPWYFGASVHQVPVLTQVSDLGGPYLVGLVLAAPSIAIAQAVWARRAGKAMPWRAIVAWASAPALSAAYGAVRVHQVDADIAASTPVRVGLVQGNMPLMQGDHLEGLRRHLRATAELRQQGVDFVVWSEAAVLIGTPLKGYDAFLQQRFTRTLGVPAVLGVELYDRSTGRFRAFNSAITTDLSGHSLGRYDKQYPLPFGEYIPFGETFPQLYEWSPNSGHLTPGTSLEPLPLLGHRITGLICYEDILPAFVNDAVRHGKPHMLVNLTNDAWFGDTTEPWIHLALAKLRAVEHHRYLVRATNSGVSAVVDPVGRVVAHGGTAREETVQGLAHWMEGGLTGYEMVGNVPWWSAAAASLVMSFWRPRRRRSVSASSRTTDREGAERKVE